MFLIIIYSVINFSFLPSDRCPNLAVQEADDSEAEEDDDVEKPAKAIAKVRNSKTPTFEVEDNQPSEVRWIGESIYSNDDIKYFRYVWLALSITASA